MNYLKRLSVLLCSSLVTLAFVACNSSDDDGGGGLGPSSGASFAGVVMTINPDITFVDGTTFSYLNETSGGIDFPQTSGTPFTGTFIYAPSSSFQAGTLTLDFDGPEADIVIELDNFVVASGNVTAARATVSGNIYNVTFSGNLQPAPKPNNGGGSEATLPSEIAGNTYALVFFDANTPNGFPYAEDDTETFSFGADGRLTVVGTGEDWGLPFQVEGNQFEYFYSRADIDYVFAVSQAAGGGLNEINVGSQASGGIFYGQFYQDGDTGNGDGNDGDDNDGDTGDLGGTYTATVASRNIVIGTPPAGLNFAQGSSVQFTIEDNGTGIGQATLTISGSNYPQLSRTSNQAIFEVAGTQFDCTLNGNGQITSIAVTFASTSPASSGTYTFSNINKQ